MKPHNDGLTVRGLSARAAALAGVAGLAITQPVLDLFGRNPEFFVAGRYGSRQIIAFALIVALVPAAVAIVGVTIASLAHPTAGAVVYSAALAGFVVLFALIVLDNVGVDALWLAAAGAGICATAVVWLEHTRRAVRTFLSYVAIGNMAFLLMFLFASPTAELIGGSAAAEDLGTVRIPALQGPVLVVILDEFPVTTIMRPDGSINSARYPNFARLAEGSTWFRNASSHYALTSKSVPSMLTGKLSDSDDLPTYQDHPRNLFSLFGARYPINRYETVTDMCPPTACDQAPRGSLSGALRDSGIAYGHQVLPGELADRLPSIDHSWGDFGSDLGPAEGDASEAGTAATTSTTSETGGDDPYGRWRSLEAFDKSSLGQFNAFQRAISLIDSEPSVNFIHVALPHYPWTLTPWGTRLTHFPSEFTEDPDDPAYDLAGVQRYQLHALQVGAADVAVGALIDRLQQTGAWDDALVVVTSDHGASLLPPDFGRKLTMNSREELLRMPLFIKAPGQSSGEVRDQVAQTIDIFPSIIDVVGASTDWDFDGHSLYDGSKPTTDPKVDPDLEPALDVVSRHAADFAAGDDWIGLAAVGDHGDLVGTAVRDFRVGEPSQHAWSPDDRDVFASLPTTDGRVPYMLGGTVTTADGRRPPELVVSVNGTIGGVVGAYEETDNRWRFTGVMGPLFERGANEVTAYEVERTPTGVVLHPVGAG